MRMTTLHSQGYEIIALAAERRCLGCQNLLVNIRVTAVARMPSDVDNVRRCHPASIAHALDNDNLKLFRMLTTFTDVIP